MSATTPYTRSIHALVNRVGMSDDQYRDMLKDKFGAASSKDLTGLQCRTLCADLLSMCPKTSAPAKATKRYEDLSARGDGFASPRQIRMLEAAFVEISYMHTLPEKQAAFQKFLKNRFSIPSIEWISPTQVGPILKAIQSIKVTNKPQTEASHG